MLSFASNIMRKSILFFTMSNSKSNFFVTECMFNWVHINLFTFLSLRFSSILFRSSISVNVLYCLLGVSQSWFALSLSRGKDVFKQMFHYWCQFSFSKNLELMSLKNLIPWLFTCNLLPFNRFLGILDSIFNMGKEWKIPFLIH